MVRDKGAAGHQTRTKHLIGIQKMRQQEAVDWTSASEMDEFPGELDMILIQQV